MKMYHTEQEKEQRRRRLSGYVTFRTVRFLIYNVILCILILGIGTFISFKVSENAIDSNSEKITFANKSSCNQTNARIKEINRLSVDVRTLAGIMSDFLGDISTAQVNQAAFDEARRQTNNIRKEVKILELIDCSVDKEAGKEHEVRR